MLVPLSTANDTAAATEPLGEAEGIHRNAYGEASSDTDGKSHSQVEQACRLCLQKRKQQFAEECKNRGEKEEWQRVATKILYDSA